MLRLTGGIFRGQSIQTPNQSQTRPTQSKLRQALFNSLQSVTPEAYVLDLFAGSGALGFESLSRGASQVVFVESSPGVAQCILRNAQHLKVMNQIKLLNEALPKVIPRLIAYGPFDLVLADPPYDKDWGMFLLSHLPWSQLLTMGAYFCLEWRVQKINSKNELPDEVAGLQKVREKKYGDSVLTTYLRC